MGKRFVFVFWLVLSFAATLVSAADVEVKASVDAEKIGVDDVLLYTLSFKGISNPPQPDLSGSADFTVAQTSRSFRQEYVNGNFSQSVEFIFYLLPSQTGTLEIPPYTYRHEGKDYTTRGFKIEVVKGSLKSSQGRSGRRRSPFGFDEDLFSSPFERRNRPQTRELDIQLRAVVSKRSLVKGEQALFKVLLYTNSGIQSVNMLSNQSFPGFWQEWYPVERSIEGRIETLEGKQYRVFEIRKAALFPTASGTVTIPPLKFELLLRVDPFSIFPDAQKIYRSSPAVELQVTEPPPDALGLPVGRFNFKVSANKKEIDINDILTVSLRIEGQGNLKTVNPPLYESNNYFKVFPAKISRDNRFEDDAIAGRVECEIPVSFKETGLISFPPLQFRFFDPGSGKVVTLDGTPLAVKVTGAREQRESATTVGRTEIVKTGEDIDFIKVGTVYHQEDYLHRRGWFTLAWVLCFLVNVIYMLKVWVYDRFISQSPLLKSKKLLAKTVKALQSAGDYGEILPVLENYLTQKTHLSRSEIDNYSIERLFDKHGVSQKDGKAFVRIKAESESARFSPTQKDGRELKRDLKLLIEILKRLDGKIK